MSGIFIAANIAPLGLIGGCVIGFINFGKHTCLLPFYKERIQLKVSGQEIDPSQMLEKMVEKVSDEVKEAAYEIIKPNIVPTMIPGLKTLHAGTVATHQGGIIGLPILFELENREDVAKSILVTKTENWNNEVDQDIYDCFLLSDQAKKYAIAREILLLNSVQVYTDTVIPFLVFPALDAVMKKLEFAFCISKRRPFISNSIYTGMIVGALSLWLFLYSMSNQYFESGVAESVSKLGIDYIKGGVEYHSKEIKRNLLSVKLQNQDICILKRIEDMWNSFISFSNFPDEVKKSYFEIKLKSLEMDVPNLHK